MQLNFLTCSNISCLFNTIDTYLKSSQIPSSLYGPGQLFYYPADPREERELESVFLRTLDTLGELSTVVHSTANTPLQVQYGTVNSTVQYSTVQYGTIQYSTVQYSTVQYS